MVGIISLVVLAGVIVAYYVFHLARSPGAGSTRSAQMLVQYLLVFVLVVQFFRKVPALHGLAPTLSEPPFAIAQAVVLVIFVALTIAAAVKFRPA